MSTFNPRLNTSTKWTEVPPDFLLKVRSVFQNQFKTQSTAGEFIADGQIYPSEVLLRVGYIENGRLKQINFEASMDSNVHDEAGSSALLDRLFLCVDIIGSLMEEYFSAGEDIDAVDIPLHWKDYEFEGETIHLQYSTVNTRLEDEANRLLGLIGDALVNERETNEDALLAAQIDSDLAFDIQKSIREGTYRPEGSDAADPN